MIIPDANVLLYAYNSATPQHEAARKWVETVFSGPESVRLPWQTIHAFLRIGTHPRIFPHPYTIGEAAEIVGSWLEAPAVDVIEPGERYWEILVQLLMQSQVRGPLVTDAALAALAVEWGATLATTDRDFRRFDGLKLLDPLSEG